MKREDVLKLAERVGLERAEEIAEIGRFVPSDRPMPTEAELEYRDRALFMAETHNGNWDD